MAVYTVRLQNVSGPDVVSLTDGTTYATLAVNPSVGPRGAGWTGVSYATGTGRFTFTSNDGLGYTSDDIRVNLDADLLDGQHGSYYTGYTDTAIANLIDTAPATLDTLNELAAALGDDPNFATTVTNNIATKVSKAGDTMTGNLSFGDNNKALFGAGSDLEIYHDGSNSWIRDGGTGDLVITTNGAGIQFKSNGSSEQMLRLFQGGPVRLYYDNAEKLTTTSTGVNVTGTVTADGLTVDVADGKGVFVAGGAGGVSEASYYFAQNERASFGYDGSRVSISDINSSGLPANKSLSVSLGGAQRLFINHSTGDISFYEDTGTTPKFFWDASAERLGIGSIAPSEALTVVGKAVLGDVTTSLNQLTINGGHVADGGNDYGLTISSFEPAITLIDRSTGAGSVQLFGTNNGGMWIRGDTANDGTIGHTANTTDFMVAKFEPINTIFYTNGAESMRIDSSGRVGVGETTPSSSLHITENEITAYNGAATDGQLGAGSSLFLRQDGGSNTALSQIVFQPRTGYGYNRIVNSGGSAPYMAFATNNAERARIDASGNLLVGTTSSAGGRLRVEGGSGQYPAWFYKTTTEDVAAFIIQHARANGGTVATQLYFMNSTGGGTGSITSTGSSTSYNTSSDYRLKEDVQPMTGASERVLALNPVNFAWKDGGHRVDGFLAHEAQEVVPEAVHGVKDGMREEAYEVTPAVYDDEGNLVSEAVMGTREVPDYQGIDQSKLVPLLTAALQEALTEIAALKDRVAALEA